MPCTSEMWSSHTMEYYSAIKMKEVWKYATMWMNMILIEMSQRQNDQFHFHTVSRRGKFIGAGNIFEGTWGQGEEGIEH